MKSANNIFLTLVLVIAFGITACNESPDTQKEPEKTPLADKLQQALDDAVDNPETQFPGALLYVSGPEIGGWSGAAGLADMANATPMKPDDKFRAGSVIKPFISAVVLQLVEEGVFSLDDTMTALLPDDTTAKFVNSDRITMRMLLDHTAGIADCFTEETVLEITADPERVWEMDEYLDISAAQGPDYPPGERSAYSNTDYILLGLIIIEATGNTWRDEVRERIIKPLNLSNTLLPEPGDTSIPGSYARGYQDVDGIMADLTIVDPSMADAAGGHALVTTTTDLAIFLDALLAGELFTDATSLDYMMEFREIAEGHGDPAGWGVGYGLGMMEFVFPGDILGIGHGGDTPGYSCFVYRLPAQEITIAGMVNDYDWEASHVELLLPVLEILIPDGTE